MAAHGGGGIGALRHATPLLRAGRLALGGAGGAVHRLAGMRPLPAVRAMGPMAARLADAATPTVPSTFHVTTTPNLATLPGGTVLTHLVNGISAWALVLALAGLVIGAGMWALGSHSQNYQQSYAGKRAVLVSALAALVIGIAPLVINYFARAPSCSRLPSPAGRARAHFGVATGG